MSGAVVDATILRLLGRGRVHPALHVDGRGVILGRVTEAGEYEIVTSDREVIAPADARDVLLLAPRPYADLAGRWADDDAADFLASDTPAVLSDVLALLLHEIDAALELPRPELRSLIATWVVASYFHPLLLTFPRLALSGERESGKSKVLAILRATAWNALLMLNPTPAVLYRLVQEFRATLLLDEVEGLNKDDARDVLAIINAGYKAGATVPRCEGKEQRRVESFAVYAPLALAAIKHPNATTEDRCVPLVLQRGKDRQRLNAEVDVNAPAFVRIRGLLHRSLLTRWSDVAEAYRSVSMPSWLNGRARELWKPLLAVAGVADAENGLAITPDLVALAREHVDDRPGVSSEAEALLAVLAERINGSSCVTVGPRDLREPLRDRLGWRDAPSAETVGALLRRLNFRRVGKGRAGARYEVTAERIAELRARYGVAEEEA